MSADIVVALRGYSGMRITYRTKAVLPPGPHRVTVHDDGTVEVVGLRPANRREHALDCVTWVGWPCSCGAPPLWADDVPAEPERSPQVSDVSASEPRDGAR